MKISELKQPYRRMAEYLGNENNTISHSLNNNFFRFYNKMHKGEYPEITPEIKTNFPSDFDFSEEEESLNQKYTQLAKEGRFNELPETCEFSEPVELEVWDDELSRDFRKIIGKFKGFYMDIHCIGWKNAQLPTKKIDFTQFKSGDVVEVELIHNEIRIGWFDYVDNNNVVINVLKRKGNQVCNGGSCAGSKMLNKEKIKSITKIK